MANKSKEKLRADLLLQKKYPQFTLAKIKSFIMAGQALSPMGKIKFASEKLPINTEVSLKIDDIPFVSRGGLKLAHAIKHFNILVNNKVALDVGSSTGGFTDCLLQNGAKHVYALDVGTNQLDYQIRQNTKVTVLEQTNFRNFQLSYFDQKPFPNIIVSDVSFISLTLLAESFAQFLQDTEDFILLIKPQFELKKELIEPGGLVSNPKTQQLAIEQVKKKFLNLGFQFIDLVASPIKGKKIKNQEFLIHFKGNH